MIKYTKEELMKMPLKIVRGLDIRTADEEALIQEVVNSRASIAQPVVKFNQIVPDIKTAEQEQEWQKKIDKFNEENTPIEAKIVNAEKMLEGVKEIIETVQVAPTEVPPVVPTVVTVSNGEIIKPFCDKCDSKGVRHKKVCPLYEPIKQNADINTVPVQ